MQLPKDQIKRNYDKYAFKCLGTRKKEKELWKVSKVKSAGKALISPTAWLEMLIAQMHLVKYYTIPIYKCCTLHMNMLETDWTWRTSMHWNSWLLPQALTYHNAMLQKHIWLSLYKPFKPNQGKYIVFLYAKWEMLALKAWHISFFEKQIVNNLHSDNP